MSKSTLEEIENVAKQVMELRKEHQPQLLVELPDGKMAMILLIYHGEKEKEKMRDKMRELINRLNCERYFYISEAWVSFVNINKPDMPYVQPRRHIDRKEGLVISEIKKDMTGRSVFCLFHREGDKIIWDERSERKQNEENTYWDFFLEKQGISEIMNKSIKTQNDNFLRNLSKELSDKYKKEFFSAETPEERLMVLAKLVEEAKQRRDDIEKKIYEDLEAEEYERQKD
jgi:hypothetical protein